MSEADVRLESYDYCVPPEQIAQEPGQMRGNDRLMILSRSGAAKPLHDKFCNIDQYLPENALLVINNTRVTKCRLEGKRENGGSSEFLLLTPLPCLESSSSGRASVQGLLRPAAKSRPGSRIYLPGGMQFIVEGKGRFGQCGGTLLWEGELQDLLERHGQLPLPPYIRRKADKSDETAYQTIFASNGGSVAAPTAGLHFTPESANRLAAKGVEITELTLHVGYGTFSPVRVQDIRQHEMHAEYVEILPETAQKIAAAKSGGRPVIAVGTTSARALEGSYQKLGRIAPYRGMVDIFIYPGKKFNIIDGLITNFHLPKSTLLMLVSAFAGRERMLAAYREAIAKGYRLFSYGDAMLIKN